MLDQLKPDMQELIDLVRQAENYDATLAASQLAGKPIDLRAGAADERRRKGERINSLRVKWNI
jgi:hypothetical protein